MIRKQSYFVLHTSYFSKSGPKNKKLEKSSLLLQPAGVYLLHTNSSMQKSSFNNIISVVTAIIIIVVVVIIPATHGGGA